MPITGLEDDIRALGLAILEDAATQLIEDLKDLAPVETGQLRDSAYGPIIDEAQLTATIGFEADQADYTDLGTRPHEITAVNAPNLVFFWERGPRGPGVYTFPTVDHPGYQGTGWFSDKVADDSWQDYVDQAARQQP